MSSSLTMTCTRISSLPTGFLPKLGYRTGAVATTNNPLLTQVSHA